METQTKKMSEIAKGKIVMAMGRLGQETIIGKVIGEMEIFSFRTYKGVMIGRPCYVLNLPVYCAYTKEHGLNTRPSDIRVQNVSYYLDGTPCATTFVPFEDITALDVGRDKIIRRLNDVGVTDLTRELRNHKDLMMGLEAYLKDHQTDRRIK